ncbi:major facilitator superfamily domain-containing protein [Echria macrotheca]|uniref:Major facilitator superfamily domain-containing protein n=1 Tax=Echria macrotheca TaxID=438768 RepID=A0AAJ0F819_9PEZI|nr:major facilitator superfamily domain-containing protein [Echria macrotheca]
MPAAVESECTPLLPSESDPNHESQPNNSSIAGTPYSQTKRLVILAVCYGLLIILGIGGTLCSTPIIDIQEAIICRRFHGPDVDHDDPACKDKDVQGELSFIRGWHVSLTLLTSLIASVPYGAMADRYGRTIVLGLSFLGATLTECFGALVCAMPHIFHPRAIWAGSLFQLVGGGEAILSAMVYTILADISSEAQRATAFFYLGASLMGGALIANPLVFLAMKRGPWFSISIGLSCLAASTVIAFLTPETLSYRQQHAPSHTENNNAAASSPVEADTTAAALKPNPLLQRASAALSQTLHSVRFLFWEHKLVGFLLLSLGLEIFGRSVVLQLMQYASRRFHMSYSEAGLLASVIAFTSLLLLLVVLPGTSQLLLSRLGFSARQKDLRLAQASAALAALGVILQGVARDKVVLVAGIVVAGMGGGYTFMVRGLMTALVDGRETGLLYTSIAFIEALSALVSGPVYAGLFHLGLEWGDEWVGLPFLFAGCVLVTAAVLVGVVSSAMVGKGTAVEEETDEADDVVGSGRLLR